MKKMKRTEAEWPEVWKQVLNAMERHGASEDVKKAAQPDNVGWNYGNGRLYLFCPQEVYEWMEKPTSPDMDSNLKYIKPIIWPFMMKYNCKDLVYKLIKL